MNTQKFPLINQCLFERHYHFTGRNPSIDAFPSKAKAEYGEIANFAPFVTVCLYQVWYKLAPLKDCVIYTVIYVKTEWHVVRIKCTNCELTGKLNYWS